MKASIVLPVYNKAAWLRECVDSILSQTFTDFELIAVDDRSTDDSLAILRSYTDPRMQVEALPRNLGPAGAVQRAMDMAQGAYIVRMDADDLMLPQRVACQVAFMDAHPHIGASGGTVRLFGAEHGEWRYHTDPDDCRADLLFGVPIPQGSSIMRTAVLRSSGVRYQDHWPRIGEDWLFWSALARHTAFSNVPDPLILYRRGDQNIAHGHDKAATRRERIALVLGSFGLEPSAQQVEAHLLASHILTGTPTVHQVQQCHAWLEHLRHWNRNTGFAAPAALDRRLDRAWTGLFHRLADRAFMPAWAHLRASGPFHAEHLLYLLKRRAKALLGA